MAELKRFPAAADSREIADELLASGGVIVEQVADSGVARDKRYGVLVNAACAGPVSRSPVRRPGPGSRSG
jgi:hypothetical protein